MAEIISVEAGKDRIYRVKLGNDIITMTSQELKTKVKNGTITLSNYKLTKDDRLIKRKTYYKYLLMNKDKEICTFDLAGNLLFYSDKKPYDFEDVLGWIELRAKFSCARNVREFLKSIGICNLDDFINITHCVSLHDTFWIKFSDSKTTWKQVSPYTHSYSKVISSYALEGLDIGIHEKNYFTPVMSTNGSFPHTWKFNNGKITFVKASSKYTLGGSNSGREPYSEYYASIVADYLGFNHVPYTIREHKRQDKRVDIVTECRAFTDEKTGTVTAYWLGLDTYEKVIEYCKYLNKESYKTIIDMLFLDCLLLNTDRHFSNIEFLVDNETMRVKEISPIFDNNFSFLPRFIEGFDTFNREDYIVRDGRTFKELYELVKRHHNYNSDLIRLKQLVLEKPKAVQITDNRLKFLNDFLQMQVQHLLKS